MTKKIERRSTCKQCGKSLQGKQRLWCSIACIERYQYYKTETFKKNQLKKHDNCLACGKDIKNNYIKKKYCCRQCSQTYLRKKNRVMKIKPYLLFLRKYCSHHKFFTTRQITLDFMKKNNLIQYKFPYNHTEIEIRNIFSGIMRSLSLEKYITRYSKSYIGFVYKSNENLFKGIDDILSLKIFKSYNLNRVTENSLYRQEWRNFEDLEKTEILKYEKSWNGKLHFLGTIDEIDPHFRQLCIENGIL